MTDRAEDGSPVTWRDCSPALTITDGQSKLSSCLFTWIRSSHEMSRANNSHSAHMKCHGRTVPLRWRVNRLPCEWADHPLQGPYLTKPCRIFCGITYSYCIPMDMSFGISLIFPCWMPIGKFPNMDPLFMYSAANGIANVVIFAIYSSQCVVYFKMCEQHCVW